MAYRELVRRWHEGVLAADAERWDAALDTFAGIPEPPSRIRFNIGCVELLAGRPRQALRGWGPHHLPGQHIPMANLWEGLFKDQA
ncbi:NADPH oxidase activator 1-like isoform X2 [Melanerpes formicivorus]|uniref:NADPH oxidase activator 1-like isoform X2 n=1 Tax=Melanerpes formicivorus TaxID=211600 RepID=UPI00358F5606